MAWVSVKTKDTIPYTTVEVVKGIEAYMKKYGIEDINELIGCVK